MISDREYIVMSLDLHLFFARIMKEHAIFLEAGFTPKNADFARMADSYKNQFEKLLLGAIHLSAGIVSPDVLNSGELFTDYTPGAEQKTQNFTGIVIDQNLTSMEARLHSGINPPVSAAIEQRVRRLNTEAKVMLDNFINFKSNVLNGMLSCTMFTVNYPLLVDHILREAKMYREMLLALEDGSATKETTKDMELFWDQIMLEHALFIRGLLDPSEGELINTSNDFAQTYGSLLKQAQTATDAMLAGVTAETLEETMKYRDFKEAGTRGIAECKIRSIILPLLADHVLREANHYIRLLQQV